MARLYHHVKAKTFTPTAVGSSETIALLSLRAGDRVHSISIVPLVAAQASTTSTITIGDDAGATAYFNTAYDPEAAVVGTPLDADGTALAASGGKLYTAADTVDLVYTANGATGTAPKCRVTIVWSRENKV